MATKSNNEIVLMYSGGLDSTYVADSLAEQYDKVRLITYIVPSMYGVQRSLLNASIVKKKYGAEKISHEIVDIRKYVHQIRGTTSQVIKDCFKYRFCKPFCVGCKVTMHACTLAYSLKNNITTVADGNNKAEATHALEQLPEAIELFKNLYNQYNINYICPIYNKAKLSQQGYLNSFLDKLCLVNRRPEEKKELKEKGYALGTPLGDMHRTIQPQCWMNPIFGLISSIVNNDREGLMAYIKDKIIVTERLLKEEKLDLRDIPN